MGLHRGRSLQTVGAEQMVRTFELFFSWCLQLVLWVFTLPILGLNVPQIKKYLSVAVIEKQISVLITMRFLSDPDQHIHFNGPPEIVGWGLFHASNIL